MELSNKMQLCDYGCGQEAKIQMKNGKWCCSEKWQSCPYYKEQKRKNMMGKKNHFYGKNHKNEAKKKMRKSHIGKKLSFETKLKMSLSRKGLNTGIENPMFDMTKEKSPRWSGGYYNNNIPKFDVYAHQISYVEKTRRNKDDENILEVTCSVCDKWYIPSRCSVYERIRSLNSGICENKFYCSDECKNSCSVFKKILYQENHPKHDIKYYNNEEYQQFREHVLERDNYKCQYCGEEAEHVHHERPQKLEPFFALDPDYAWSVCKKCHYEKGHQDECSTGKLAKIICT